MKRIIATGAVATLAMVGLAGTASANGGPVPGTPQCFGQVHKLINTEGFGPYENVGQLVKVAGGQGKNMAAKDICAVP
jgi:hypothetical protein